MLQLRRTGPAALTQAMYDYFNSMGTDMRSVNSSTITSNAGLKVGDMRLLPLESLGGGWEVVNSRTGCASYGNKYPNALVCHQFWGSWKPQWTLRPHLTYNNCTTHGNYSV
jgi:hypothetical protein